MIRGVNHITLTTTDLARAFRFYTEVLGARPLARWRTGAYLMLGELWLCLDVGAELNSSIAYTHVAFDVAPDAFETLAQRIRQSGATIWKENRSEGASLYFMDRDNHKLEIHVGGWQTRLAAMKENPWDPQTEFFPAGHG